MNTNTTTDKAGPWTAGQMDAMCQLAITFLRRSRPELVAEYDARQELIREQEAEEERQGGTR